MTMAVERAKQPVEQASKQASRQAGKQASKQASRQAGRQAGRPAGDHPTSHTPDTIKPVAATSMGPTLCTSVHAQTILNMIFCHGNFYDSIIDRQINDFQI
ncbi:hypothetical protein V1477_010964 [Vespula maculifrons]|uniref:Uncharacterized protein n=1 Tax=Vespula maculifrons TaxID=7453 RepID=A0ABD2C3G1_VESMC